MKLSDKKRQELLSKLKPSYADRSSVKHSESNTDSTYAGKAGASATVLPFVKKNMLEPTKFWDGFVLGLNSITSGKADIPIYTYAENNVTTELEAWLKKADATLDPQDFAFSMVSNWNEVRDFLTDTTEGFEPVKSIPSIYTLRWYFNQLVACYKLFLEYNRSTLFIYGVAPIQHVECKYVSPAKEDIATPDDALSYLLEQMVK